MYLASHGLSPSNQSFQPSPNSVPKQAATPLASIHQMETSPVSAPPSQRPFPYTHIITATLNILTPPVALLTATWTNPSDDTAVTNAALDMFTKANAYATANGKLSEYIYLNYAYKTEKPISGYGSANVQKLESISKKYDPAGIFQNQVPGGFKLATS
jgi:hypothetical protein